MAVSDDFIRRLPKAELHLHIEGSFEPELLFEIARRNDVSLPYATVDDLKAAYDFADLQAFLDLYYAGMSVLLKEQDFYDLTAAYMTRAVADGVVHTEIFFDPQGHTERGVAFEVALDGIWRALRDAEAAHGITSRIIMCFLRHLDEDDVSRKLWYRKKCRILRIFKELIVTHCELHLDLLAWTQCNFRRL